MVIGLKIHKVRSRDQARDLILTHQKFISLKTVVEISFAIKGVFPEDLGPMLSAHRTQMISSDIFELQVFQLKSLHTGIQN